METNQTQETNTTREHTIAVQLDIELQEGGALEITFPRRNLIALVILTKLIGTALDGGKVRHSTNSDYSELNIGLILVNTDQLGEALTVVEEILKEVALLTMATIGYVDARESGGGVLHWRTHYPKDGGGIDLNAVLTPEVMARKAQATRLRNAALGQWRDSLRGGQ